MSVPFPFPKFDSESLRVLQVIKERGVVNGSQLLNETGLDMDKTIQAVSNLSKADLISVKGSFFNPQDFLSCYFNIRPSNFGIADLLIKTS